MAKSVMMCNMPVIIAAKVFEMLNPGKVKIECSPWLKERRYIQTDCEPNSLVYPEGWYYDNGCFTNKHTTTTGLYEEIRMIKSSSAKWKNFAPYCTLEK